MKKVEVSVDFIKEAHQSACANWKQRIEKELPDLFNLETLNNKWYIMSIGKVDYLVLSNGIKLEGKAWIVNGEYASDTGTFDFVKREATEEEVKTALVNEAVKRGFVDGAKTDCLVSMGGVIISKPYFERDRLKVRTNNNNSGYAIIFREGKWATPTILQTEKELLGDKIKDLEKNLEEVKSLYDKL